MRTLTRISIAFALVLFAGTRICAQENPPKPPQEAVDGFYSGTIAELSDDKVTVSRTILGKPAEKHTFLINADTKVEGKMKPKIRVTVRYVASEQGDTALSILVRDKQDKKK